MKQSSRRMGVNRLEGQSVVAGQLWPWERGWGLSPQLSQGEHARGLDSSSSGMSG